MRRGSQYRPVLILSLTICTTGIAHAVEGVPSPNQSEQAQSIIQSGNRHGAPPCASCHGYQGEGNPLAGFPRLAGLPEKYLARTLTSLQQARRNNPMMTPIAKSLSAEEIILLSRFYAQQPVPQTFKYIVQNGATPTQLALGRKLVLQGEWSRNIPACSQCHSLDVKGVGDNFPPITAQSYSYVFNQLNTWRQGKREKGPLNLMGTIAQRLTPEEIQAIAHYLSQQQKEM